MCGVLVSLLMSACGPLAFRADERVVVTAPESLSLVTVPFQVRWTSVGAHRSRYAVFVDTAPIAPGHGMRDVADNTCRVTPGCPDDTYLTGRGIYVTSEMSVVIRDLQRLGGTDGRMSHPVHRLVVVRMDATGHRLGEASWQVEFRA